MTRSQPARLIVVVAADGTVSARTEDVLGPACLDYIAVLEDLLDATTVSSAYTADFARSAERAVQHEENRDELRDT